MIGLIMGLITLILPFGISEKSLMVVLLLFLMIVSYMIGSFNTALVISRKVAGIDIRDYGSGNAGATNVYRVLGPQYGLLTFMIDGLKGLLAIQLVYCFPNIADADYMNERIALQICLGFSVLAGHVFPVFNQFKGGKGVATLLGVAIGINFVIAIGLLAIFIFVVALTNYISLGSMIAGVAYPVIVIVFIGNNAIFFVLFSLQAALFLLFTHRKNIIRLLRGSENKFINSKNTS